ncbi:hypothetical protein C8F01DRAFT_1260633 [Mycena amicta]|nr:hypothetical protein C8F01DRAFT_1260633 [Mycena amicta]
MQLLNNTYLLMLWLIVFFATLTSVNALALPLTMDSVRNAAALPGSLSLEARGINSIIPGPLPLPKLNEGS